MSEHSLYFTQKFLIFKEMEFPGCNIKKVFIFSQKKCFFIFPIMKPCPSQPKPEKSPLNGNGTLSYFRKRKSRKNSLYFRK